MIQLYFTATLAPRRSTSSANGQIDVTSLATFAGTLDIVFENGFQPAVGEQFQLSSLGSETGQFSEVDLPPGYSVNTSNLYTTGNITVTAVPEPVGAVGIAGLAMASLRRRKVNRGTRDPFIGREN